MDGYSTDPASLMAVGKYYLPELAAKYGDLSREVAASDAHDGAAFTPCPKRQGVDAIRGNWTALRQRLQDYLVYGSKNFTAAGDAMVHIVNNYEAAETQTKNAVAQVWGDGTKVPPRYLYPGDPNQQPAPLPNPQPANP